MPCVLSLCAGISPMPKYAITTAACSLAVFNDEERKRERRQLTHAVGNY